jgi:hypothetical protein
VFLSWMTLKDIDSKCGNWKWNMTGSKEKEEMKYSKLNYS